MPGRASRDALRRLAPLLAALVAAGAAGADDLSRSRAELAVRGETDTPWLAERRVEALVETWFAALADPSREAGALLELIAEVPFELALEGTVLRGRDALARWLADLRAGHADIEFALDPIRVERQEDDLWQVRLQFERRSRDPNGLAHVARREQRWLVRSGPISPPRILRIDERTLLAFPGTGPQMVCY